MPGALDRLRAALPPDAARALLAAVGVLRADEELRLGDREAVDAVLRRLGATAHVPVVEWFPGYHYWEPAGDRAVLCDMRDPRNQVGHQQRAFTTWWALRCCGPLDLGLDLGSHRGLTPLCVHVDLHYGAGRPHPIYGGEAPSDVVADASRLSVFPTGAFPLVVSNHSLEHMPAGRGGLVGDEAVVAMLRDEWLRVLRPGGHLAAVVPDDAHFDVMASDRDHRHAWSHEDFRQRVLDPLVAQTGAEVVEFDTLDNHFSFNFVLRKR